jgi:hypothetical protein
VGGDGVFDFAGGRKAAGPLLREHQIAVDGHLEDAAAALDELWTKAEVFFQLVRQTGGSRQVVSNDAVLDRDLR